MMTLHSRLLSDRSGTSTIELALIFPILALLTFVAADVAMAFKAKIKLQAAAERTAQMATAGGLDSDAYPHLAEDAAQAANVPSGNVTVTPSLLCDGTVQVTTNEVCGTGTQVKRYVQVNINGNYMPMFAALVPGTRWTGSSGIAISGSSSVRLQ